VLIAFRFCDRVDEDKRSRHAPAGFTRLDVSAVLGSQLDIFSAFSPSDNISRISDDALMLKL
jgi:hypothetical protein